MHAFPTLGLLLAVLLAASVDAQEPPPGLAEPTVKMERQGNLSKKDREDLDRQLSALVEKRKQEREQDLADMMAKKEASSFAPLKGEFLALPSGLLQRDLVVGVGPELQVGDTVETRFTGWLLDGTEVMSSEALGGLFPVVNVGRAGVIAAWNEGLVGMREGGKRLLVVPSALGYGKGDSMTGLPGGSHLVYEIEAVRVHQGPRRPSSADLKFVRNESGLRWATLAEGEGEAAGRGDTLAVHFSAWLAEQEDESAFDSTFLRGSPLVIRDFGAEPMLDGLLEGLSGMKPGGRRLLLIPPELGFGKKGHPGVVPPNATLLYSVGLHAILPARPALDELELVTNESGLKWAELRPGEGRAAAKGDTVTVHHAGWLEDGRLFDSSWPLEGPIVVANLGAAPLIAGWNEGLQGLRVGGRRVLVVPPILGYGEAGHESGIPPGATLTFVVDMLEAKPGSEGVN